MSVKPMQVHCHVAGSVYTYTLYDVSTNHLGILVGMEKPSNFAPKDTTSKMWHWYETYFPRGNHFIVCKYNYQTIFKEYLDRTKIDFFL